MCFFASQRLSYIIQKEKINKQTKKIHKRKNAAIATDASASVRHLQENESFHNVDFQRKDLGLLNDVEIQNLETFQNNFLSPEQVIGYPKAPRRKKTREKKKRL